MTSWYPEHSANVASSSSVMALYFSCSWASSSSSLSTSFWSFWTDLSANSALASACFSLAVRDLICSLQLASLLLAFSSETSKDFKLLATTLNSSSSSIIFISPVSALSSALSKLTHSSLILDSSIFQNFSHSVRIISSSCSLVKLVGGLQHLVLTSLQITFKSLNSSIKAVYLVFSSSKSIFLLF